MLDIEAFLKKVRVTMFAFAASVSALSGCGETDSVSEPLGQKQPGQASCPKLSGFYVFKDRASSRYVKVNQPNCFNLDLTFQIFKISNSGPGAGLPSQPPATPPEKEWSLQIAVDGVCRSQTSKLASGVRDKGGCQYYQWSGNRLLQVDRFRAALRSNPNQFETWETKSFFYLDHEGNFIDESEQSPESRVTYKIVK